MTDYTKLVEALRYCADSGGMVNCNTICEYGWRDSHGCKNLLMTDAAAAIEELQAELEKKRTADCWGCKCEKVEPKRGDIVRCRECRYRITAHGISDGWVLCSKPYTERGNAMHRADWFCADGEREAQDG